MVLMSKFLLLILTCTPLFAAAPSLPPPQSEEESLFVRRILEFWKDKEYSLAERQIKTYLKTHPEGNYHDHFKMMLGDMALLRKQFPEALTYYNQIKDPNILSYIRLKKWQALYQMEAYAQLYEELSPVKEFLTEEGLFYLAEATFRGALLFPPEERDERISSALSLYEKLLTSSCKSHARLALAEIYRLLNHQDKAVTLYLELAQEEQNIEILFHVATLLLQLNRLEAEKLLERVAHSNAACSGEAAFQWLL